MPERGNWAEIKDKRMGEPGAWEAYNAARIAYELGRTVRQLRDQRCWSQTELARAAGMIQSAVACFKVGGTVPAQPARPRPAGPPLDADLIVQVTPRDHVA